MRLAFKRTITENDVFLLEPSHRVTAAIKPFDREWYAEKARNDKRYGAVLVLFRTPNFQFDFFYVQSCGLHEYSRSEIPYLSIHYYVYSLFTYAYLADV